MTEYPFFPSFFSISPHFYAIATGYAQFLLQDAAIMHKYIQSYYALML